MKKYNTYIIILIMINNLSSFELNCQQDYFGAPQKRLSITTNPKKPVNLEFPQKVNRFDWTKDSFNLNCSSFSDIKKVVSPFFQIDNPRIIDIAYYQDMLPEDGWELIDYDSGIEQPVDKIKNSSNYPFIMLYNKYRGIIRFFIMLKMKSNPNDGYTTLMNLRGIYESYFSGQSYSSLFNNTKSYNSLDNFNEYTSIYFYPYNTDYGYWNRGELDVLYDPCTCMNHHKIYLETNLFRYKEIEIDGKKGYISNEYLFQTVILAVPGDNLLEMNYNYEEVKEYYYPYYNNILGTFNLLRTPEINYSTRFKTDFEYQFKLSMQIDYVVNPAAGFHFDSIDIKARYVVEFADYPGITSNKEFYRINDTLYESKDIPIGCLSDYTLKFSSPFKETSTRVYMIFSGDFKKIDKTGATPNQFLEMPFKINLIKKDEIEFDDEYWSNTFNGDCNTKISPYNLNINKMGEFCKNREYSNYDNYTRERSIRKITDTIEFSTNLSSQTRLYDIYPNPANEFVNIEFAVENETEINIYFLDMLGKRVPDSSIKQHLGRGKYVFELHTSHLTQGLYFVILESENIKDYKKIIIQR